MKTIEKLIADGLSYNKNTPKYKLAAALKVARSTLKEIADATFSIDDAARRAFDASAEIDAIAEGA